MSQPFSHVVEHLVVEGGNRTHMQTVARVIERISPGSRTDLSVRRSAGGGAVVKKGIVVNKVGRTGLDSSNFNNSMGEHEQPGCFWHALDLAEPETKPVSISHFSFTIG